ncbi:MAG: BREX system P-loop protein BrxC [Chloroflexi bacterium]|nr:BREX system P-loop protein BrxC [Chloroflexota bacterium]
MAIRDLFATRIQERIEPVVKIADRRPAVLAGELSALVVTPQWEQYLRRILDAYVDAADRDDEQAIGIWISGFFGSGKSLLLKVLGALLEGGELGGRSVHEMFLERLPANSPDRTELQHLLTASAHRVSATAVGGNLHALIGDTSDTLALITFKLFAQARGYTTNWALAWAVEYQLDRRGSTAAFQQHAASLCECDWEDLAADADFYAGQLYQAAADTLPEHFAGGAAAVERAVAGATRNGIDARMLVERLRTWCEARDAHGRRHKVLLQLDELGQWIGGDPHNRTMQVAALAEEAAVHGGGRVWIGVTAHGDVQELSQNIQQEYYAKIVQRFGTRYKLSNEEMGQVVEQRVLQKTQPGRRELEQRFDARSGELTDLGTLERPQRVYASPDRRSVALFYPYLPWTVAVVPDIVKNIALAAGRGEALSGATRTMIGVVQGGIIETPGLLDGPVGPLLSLADVYDQVSSDVPIETKTDLNSVLKSVPEATAFTVRVARGLYLLGKAEYIPPTLENVTRALAGGLDTDLGALRRQVQTELVRLIDAGYAKQVGEEYVFLSTQQRGFQARVRERQGELESRSYELVQALKEFESDEALRFDRPAIAGGREIPLKLEIDERTVRNIGASVTLRVYSPLQRALDPAIGDDVTLNQRSNGEPNSIIVRLGEAPDLRKKLALTLATAQVAEETLSATPNGPEAEVARQARQNDLPSFRTDVRRLLAQAVRNAVLFFRGSGYQLAAGDSPAGAVRATLAQLLPQVYPRFADVPQRIANEESAVRTALAGAANSDLQALGVYKADKSINEAHVLLTTLRGELPVEGQDTLPVLAEQIRTKLEGPPFGWDGNCVKVGLALLLRCSGCKLIDNGQPVTDPTNPEASLLLTREQRFKNLRVVAVRGTLTMPEQIQIRTALEEIFHEKASLVPATLNARLGTGLDALVRRAQDLSSWANAARCPLPLAFESGLSRAGDLASVTAPAVRLQRFLGEREALRDWAALVDELETFRREHGAEFGGIRDDANRMLYLDVPVPELRRFIEDWRTLSNEHSVTEPPRWNELAAAYRAAKEALARQATTWREETTTELAQLEAQLPEQVAAKGAPPAQMESELARLREALAPARQHLETAGSDIGALREARHTLAAAQLELPRLLREIELRYAPEPVPNTDGYDGGDNGALRIPPEEDLETALSGLRQRLQNLQEQGKTVIVTVKVE